MINRIKSKFIEYDPAFEKLFISARVLLTMALSLFIFEYILCFDRSVTTWIAIFVFFAAITTAFGKYALRKKVLLYYVLSFIVALFLASLLNPYSVLGMSVTVSVAFFAFYIRRFGEEFLLFPPMITLIFTISLMQLPIPLNKFDQLIAIVGVSALLYYLILFRFSYWDTPKELKRLIYQFLKELYSNSRNYHTTLNSESSSLFYLSPKLSIIKLKQESQKFYTMGNKWIIDTERKEHWESIWAYNYIITKRVLNLRESMNQLAKLDQSNYPTYIEELQNVNTLFFSLLRTLAYLPNEKETLKMQYDLILQKLDKLSEEFFENKDLNIEAQELKVYVDVWFAMRKITVLLYKVSENVQLLK
ncbi:MAG: hypothetical protein GQ570_02765 [Helicobacteraceae bacterium]|nr:hypothetical protein [Helicobacteraceae bacterium]